MSTLPQSDLPPVHRSRRNIGAIAAAVVVVLVGAGVFFGLTSRLGGANQAEARSSVASYAGATDPSKVDPCALVTASEVTQAMGGDYVSDGPTTDPLDDPTCMFEDHVTGINVALAVRSESFPDVETWQKRGSVFLPQNAPNASGPWTAADNTCQGVGAIRCETAFLVGHIGISVSSYGEPQSLAPFQQGTFNIAWSVASKFGVAVTTAANAG